jgi:undecaprenyl-diphosphatase
MVIVLAIATWVLIPQFADLQGIVDQVKDANWRWFPLVLLMSMVTYVGATFSLSGAIPNHLPAFPTFATQVGSSFCSKLAPAGLGGMALNIRYLQKQGVDEPVAVSGVGLNSAAGLVGHVTLILIFLLWAGKDAFGGFSLPDPKWILVGIGVVVLLAALGMVITASRKLILGKLVPILRRAVHGMADVFKRPGKLAVLLFGSLSVTLSYLLGVYFSTQAFGGGLPLATVGAVYLAGAAIATAAPTPGGLGAMEAALIAGLVAAGMHNATAVPAVFMFRLATFWLPILPGWISFMWLERKEYI